MLRLWFQTEGRLCRKTPLPTCAYVVPRIMSFLLHLFFPPLLSFLRASLHLAHAKPHWAAFKAFPRAFLLLEDDQSYTGACTTQTLTIILQTLVVFDLAELAQ